jgi:hypothetical protein
MMSDWVYLLSVRVKVWVDKYFENYDQSKGFGNVNLIKICEGEVYCEGWVKTQIKRLMPENLF